MDSLPHEEKVLEINHKLTTKPNWGSGLVYCTNVGVRPALLQFSLRQITKVLGKWPEWVERRRRRAYCNKPQQTGAVLLYCDSHDVTRAAGK